MTLFPKFETVMLNLNASISPELSEPLTVIVRYVHTYMYRHYIKTERIVPFDKVIAACEIDLDNKDDIAANVVGYLLVTVSYGTIVRSFDGPCVGEDEFTLPEIEPSYMATATFEAQFPSYREVLDAMAQSFEALRDIFDDDDVVSVVYTAMANHAYATNGALISFDDLNDTYLNVDIVENPYPFAFVWYVHHIVANLHEQITSTMQVVTPV